jgi:hypothetical protein
VFKILKETDVLSVTDFLLNIPEESTEILQGIIGDLIDSKDSEILLKDVIEASKFSPILSSQFYECFRQYVLDIINRPELIQNEFITSIERKFSEESFQELLVVPLIEELLEQEKKVDDLTAIISFQKSWNEQLKDNILASRILNQVCVNHSEAIAKVLLKRISSEAPEVNWFNLLLIMKHIDEKAEEQIKSKFTLLSLTHFIKKNLFSLKISSKSHSRS